MLEELLNKLIEKGWCPMWWDAQKYKISFSRRKITIQLYHETHPKQEWIERSLRQLVSKESWLWQFVCENGMVKKNKMYYSYWNTLTRRERTYTYDNVVFRILESSMIDESGLEQFLLDNIKIDVENRW